MQFAGAVIQATHPPPRERRVPLPGSDPHRDHLRDALERNARGQDRTVLTVAGGALGLSLAFLRDVSVNPSAVWLLRSAWGFLGASLVLTLLSMEASTINIRRRMRQVDSQQAEKTRWSWATRWLTHVGWLSLELGISLLVAFAITNVKGVSS